jgi:hypothetical protein
MKKFIITSIIAALFATGTALKAQDNQNDYLGLPGDNLNLFAVMKLFQESKTLEDFERSLNDPNSNINNLDLNGDNLIDYIKVIDDVDGDVHNIVLQVAVSPVQNQDVAVFTVQHFPNGQVQIQLTGDEELYGKNYIIEPNFDDPNLRGTPNPGYTGAGGQTTVYTTYQIASWPLIRFIFLPNYVAWHSSWRWGYYPSYWHPWRPYSWNYYYGYQYNWNHDYIRNYRRIDYHRYSRYNDFYYNGRRAYSPEVNHRVQMGYYKTTYSHPEQRREGENMFAKNHPDVYKRSSTMYKTSATHRTTPTMVTRPIVNRPAVNNNEVNRRQVTPNSNKPVYSSHPDNNSKTNKRANAPVTSRPMTNPSMDRNKTVTRKPSATVPNKSTNQNVDRRTGPAKTINQPKKNDASSSNRKNVNKTETTVKKDVKKENVKKNSDHGIK